MRMVYEMLLFVSAMLTNENEGQMSNGKSSESGDVHVSVAANETVETVGTPGGTIMIIHEDDLEAAQNNMCATTDLQITNTTDVSAICLR